MRYWLMKTEPSTFSIQDLQEMPQQTDHWDGIRNYQARNLIRDEMKIGHKVLLYHSACTPPAVVGTALVVKEAYPDYTAFDPDSRYHDPKSDPEKPTWLMVDVKFESEFPRPIPLAELRTMAPLQDMMLLRKGMRLSIQPVSAQEYKAILAHSRQGS